MTKASYRFLVCADCGNSTAVIRAKDLEGKCKNLALEKPLLIARARYNPVATSNLAGVHSLPYYTVFGNAYVVGSDVYDVPQIGHVERGTQNLDRYGSEHHQFFVAVAIHQAGITAGDLLLAVTVPPAVFFDDDRRERVRNSFLEHHTVEMTFTARDGAQEEIRYTYTDVEVLPEGLIAMRGMLLNPDGKMNSKGAKAIQSGVVAIVDIGSYTTDMGYIINGKLDRGSFGKATRKGLGVRSYIIDPIVDGINRTYETEVAPEQVETAVIHYLNGGEPVVTLRNGQAVKIGDQVEQQRAVLWQAISADVIEPLDPETLKGLILVGGGAYVVQDHARDDLLRLYLGDLIDDQPHMINAESGLRRLIQIHNAG